MRLFNPLAVAAGMLLLFCSCTTTTHKTACTSKPLIDQPEDFDLGFVGDWRRIENPDMPDTLGDLVNIRRQEKDPASYVVKEGDDAAHFVLHCSAIRLTEPPDVALIQAQLSIDNKTYPSYFYAFAWIDRDRDELLTWSLDTRKLIEIIKQKELNAVIEHHRITTEITADSTHLLKLIVENARDLVTEEPTRSRHIPQEQ